MDRQRHQRVQELFEQALTLPPADRRAWLADHCADDPLIVDEVLRLVGHAEAVTDFLHQPAGVDVAGIYDAPTESTGQASVARPRNRPARIGRYRILDALGEGGMGVVYLAQRAEEGPSGARVALKLMRSTVATDDERRRFDRERRLLNALSHPNIARLIDIGTTEDDHPYFVMEYVEGRPIDRFCDENRLATDERLGLFRKVCDAVHYVHQNLIIHRDIKPGNILVTPQGEPKLLDFGISKLINPALGPEVEVTRRGFRLLTPRYASPEQVLGAPLSTATDIYSLGVLLYELLTGHWPYRVKTTELREIERAICDLEPERPSTAVDRTEGLAPDGKTHPVDPRLICLARDGAPNRVRGKLRGDIDNVVLKALEKAPRKRYASAEQLSEDIRRHLVHETVLARPPSLRYRVEKFLRRNRSAVAAVVLVVVALAAGLVVSVHQRGRAEAARVLAETREREAILARDAEARARQTAQQISDLAIAFLGSVTNSLPELLRQPGAVPVRQALGEAALVFLEKFEAATAESAAVDSSDAGLQVRLAQVLSIAGRAKADPRSGNLGDVQAALRLQTKALEIRRSVVVKEPANAAYQLLVSESLIRIGDLKRYSGAYSDARGDYEEAIRILEPLQQEPSRREDAQTRLAGALAASGECCVWLGDLGGASAAYELAQEVRRRRHAETPSVDSKRNLSVGLIDLGELRMLRGESAPAADLFRQAVALRRELFQSAPGEARSRHDLARALISLSESERADGNSPAALQAALEAESIMDRLLGEEGAAADVRHRQAWIAAELGVIEADPRSSGDQERQGRIDRASSEAQRLVRDSPDVLEHRRLETRALLIRAESQRSSGENEQARQTSVRAKESAAALVALSGATASDRALLEQAVSLAMKVGGAQ